MGKAECRIQETAEQETRITGGGRTRLKAKGKGDEPFWL